MPITFDISIMLALFSAVFAAGGIVYVTNDNKKSAKELKESKLDKESFDTFIVSQKEKDEVQKNHIDAKFQSLREELLKDITTFTNAEKERSATLGQKINEFDSKIQKVQLSNVKIETQVDGIMKHVESNVSTMNSVNSLLMQIATDKEKSK